MGINRAPFNALVDDDGSGTKGTPWNKAQIQSVLLDPIDAQWPSGAYTPVDASGGGLAFTGVSGFYCKLNDRAVYVCGYVQYPSTGSGVAALIGGLPFPVGATVLNNCSLTPGYTNVGLPLTILAQGGSSNIGIYNNSGSGMPNSSLSGKYVSWSGIYLLF